MLKQMKLRIQDDSIRLRLTKSDVEQLKLTGKVQATTSFPGKEKLTYQIVRSKSEKFNATFNSNGIEVALPHGLANQWADSDQIGLEETVDGLHLLIEKDFTCLQARADEQNDDYYPNPLQVQKSE